MARNARLKLVERRDELADANFTLDRQQRQHAASDGITDQIDVGIHVSNIARALYIRLCMRLIWVNAAVNLASMPGHNAVLTRMNDAVHSKPQTLHSKTALGCQITVSSEGPLWVVDSTDRCNSLVKSFGWCCEV